MSLNLKDELSHAISIAKAAHLGQLRKDGREYFTHVEDVASNVSDAAKPAAYLHDVLEDNPKLYPEEYLRLIFSKETVDTVVLLTRTDDVSYQDYIEKIKSNPIAREIKIADMTYNLNDMPSKKSEEKYTKYIQVLKHV